MSRIGSNLLTVAALAALILLGGGFWAQSALHVANERAAPVTVTIERGSGLRAIAERLQGEGAIANATLFMAAAKLSGVDDGLKAGEYQIPAQASMLEVLAILSEGRAVQHRVTVTEGRMVGEVVATLEAMPELTGAITRRPAEGSLAPDTYFIQRGEPRQSVLDRMARAQAERLARLWAERAPDLPIATPEEALILASIIEKETGLDGERGVVASVFINRLRQGMRLQSDPTVAYGVTGGAAALDRPLSKRDLRTATPYNTYVIDRLPPTPIANPGEAAIRAALNPDATDYLYFVADGTGGHAFARTYPEHQRNVEAWRAIERARAQSQ